MGVNSTIGNSSGATALNLHESRSFIGKISARMISQKAAVPIPIKTNEALLLLQNYEESRQGWFWSTDSVGNLTYITESVAEVLGKTSGELVGTPLVSLFLKPEKGHEMQRTLPFIVTKHSRFDGLEVQAACPATERWWAISGRPHHDRAGNFLGFRGSGIDITAQRRLSQDTSRLAMYDSLTGLANRSNMAKKLEAVLSSYQLQKRACAIMLIDLDRFKQINDTLGHPAGDALLKMVADRLSKVVGSSGEVCRLGGDEFQVMLPDHDDRGILGDLANRIIASLSQPYSVEGSRCIIGASVGIAISPFDGLTSEDMVRSADLALYAAKGNGRGRFRFHSRELQQTAEDRRVLEEDLRDALTNGQLELAYQPIVNAKSHMVDGFEALMRWNHPERGTISPALFIPIAEEANLIWQLGEWAIRTACDAAAKWPGQARVAVNVSPIQFANDQLPRIVGEALNASGLSPDRLELEITESVFMGETNEAKAMFDALKEKGVRLALDDFGTGYSSLSYLQTAPFDKIKIDQAFVRGATEPGSRNGAIITAIVALAEALGMDTTAEGIETLDELDMITKLNVSHVQGFVFSQAVFNDELCAKLDGANWVIEPTGPAVTRNERISMLRRARAIHGNHSYPIVIRNLSATGGLIYGMQDVPVGTKFVIDLGDGQLAVAAVCRSNGPQQGIQFETRLVSDGDGGLCTSRRVSPYLIASAGLPVPNVTSPTAPTHMIDEQSVSIPAFNTVQDWTNRKDGTTSR